MRIDRFEDIEAWQPARELTRKFYGLTRKTKIMPHAPELPFHLPWECKCLAQAISGKMMLRRRQTPSTLYLGVAKKEDGDLNAHAWLRAGESIILGGGGLERFAVVSTFA